MRRLFLLLLLPALLLVGCDAADPAPEPVAATVLVANQGNFSDGDGSVTAYDPETETAAEAITDLGTIIQSIELAGERLFVLANTGGRVEIFEPGGGTRLGRIEVESPRYLALAGPEKAYVTSQFYDRPSEVAVLNPATRERLGTVEVGGLAEGIAVAHGRAYVATGAFGASSEVVVIDTETDEVAERIDVGCVAPRFVLADAEGDVWVFCAGSDEAEGAVVVLAGASGEEVARFDVGGRILTAGPGQDAFFSSGTREIFAVKDEASVLRFDADANTFAGEIDLGEGAPIGALAYDAAAERLYVGRADPDNPYTAAGSVTIHARSGEEVGRFAAGVLPSHIALR